MINNAIFRTKDAAMQPSDAATGLPQDGDATPAHETTTTAKAADPEVLAVASELGVTTDWLENADANMDAHGYEGHVALALDAQMLPDIDVTLDLLTSSHHLFDVPALDFGADDSLAG